MDRSPVYRRPVHFRVLGPLEVDAGDGPLPLGGPKQRAVLASLLVHANRVVPVDALIGDVWGEDPPDKARHILHTYVSSLRKALGDGRLQGRPPGYLLVVEPAEVDADRFDTLVSEANKSLPVDPNVAIATFDDALALWRGPALADVSEQPSLFAEAARLDELRAAAQEARIEALLATGAQAKALAELEPLLARDPLRESLWGLAMLAYYRDGRQGEALNAFGRARELLADELGVDPSPELSKLHERILKQDPDLALRGEPLRGYRLLERIGSGRFGVVFRAVQPHVGRDVAVKVFHEQIAMDPGFVLRFERDAQLAAALEHPHIVPMYDYWREPGRAYLVSRYMRGGSLRALDERGGHLDHDRALRIVEQIASALAFAHRQGAAHGAVSMSNVLFDGEGNAYLGDFRVGEGITPDTEEDLRALAELARGLLGNEVPVSLAEILDTGVGATDGPGAEAIAGVAREVLEHRTASPSREPDERNPYKGLRAFTEADAGDFFGREELTQRLLTRLNEPGPGARFLAVVGPSGSGKSSVVRAGLVPALRRGGMPTSRQVVVTDLFPGRHPLDELESAIVRVATSPPTRLGDLLRDGPRGLLEAADRVAPADAELVLVVDQFEELFTLTTDERERELTLEVAARRGDRSDQQAPGDRDAPRGSLRPASDVPTVRRAPGGAQRGGSTAHCGRVGARDPQTGGTAGHPHRVGPRGRDDRGRRAPARRTAAVAVRAHGALRATRWRPADVVRVPGDGRGDGCPHGPRGPPLHGLRCRGSARDRAGLPPPGHARRGTARHAAEGRARELDALDVSEAAVDAALEAYGRHRLLTFDREPATREPTVEIAHESLLGAWSRLSSWIDAAPRGPQAERSAEPSGRRVAGLRSRSELPHERVRLDQIEGWAAATVLRRDRRARSTSRRASSTATAHAGVSRRGATTKRRSSGGRCDASGVSLRCSRSRRWWRDRSRSSPPTRATEQSERPASRRVRELAAAAVANLETDQQLSVLLAIEAVERTRSVDGSVLREAEEALHRAVTASRIVTSIPGSGDSEPAATISGAPSTGARQGSS